MTAKLLGDSVQLENRPWPPLYWLKLLGLLAISGLLFLLTFDLITISPPFLAVGVAFFLVLIWPGWLLLRLLWAELPSLIEQLGLAFALSFGLWSFPAVLLLWFHSNLAVMHWLVLIITLLLTLALLYRTWPRKAPDFSATVSDASPELSTEGFAGLSPPPGEATRSPWNFRETVSKLHWPLVSYQVAFFIALLILLLLTGLKASIAHPMSDQATYQAFLRHFLDTEQFLSRGYYVFKGLTAETFQLTPRQMTQPWLVCLALVISLAQVDMFEAYIHYIPLLLQLLSLFIFYSLAKVLFQAQIPALLACLVQILFYLSDIGRFDGTGFNFAVRLIEDKFMISFILLPAALSLTLRYLKEGQRSHLASLIIVMVGLGLIHPLGIIFYGLSFSFLGLAALLSGSLRPQLGRVWPIMGAMLVIFLIPLWQKFATPGARSALSENFGFLALGRLVVLSEKDNLYISSPDLINQPLIILAIVLTPLLLKYFRRQSSAQFMFSNMVGPLVLCYIPFITPLVGKLIPPELLYRLLWLLPISLVISFFLNEWVNVSSRRFASAWLPVVPIGLVLVGALLLRGYLESGIDRLTQAASLTISAEMKAVLAYLRQHGNADSVILTPGPKLDDAIPALVGHSHGLTFRGAIPPPSYASATADRRAFYNSPYINNEQLTILRKYNIKYVILDTERELSGQFNWLPHMFKRLYANQRYVLYQWRPALAIKAERGLLQGNSNLLETNLAAAETNYRGIPQGKEGRPLAQLGLAFLAEARLDFKEALKNYERGARRFLDDPWLQIKVANLSYRTGRARTNREITKLIDHYKRALEIAPENKAVYDRVLDAYARFPPEFKQTRAGRQLRSAMLTFYETWAERAIYDYKAQKALAQVYEKLGDEVQAVIQYYQLRQRFPSTLEPYMQQARIFTKQKRIEEALQTYHQAQALAPGSGRVYLSLASLYRRQGDYQQALDYAQQAVAASQANKILEGQAHYEQGLIYQAQDQKEAALAHFLQAAESNPTNIKFQITIGHFYESQQGQPEQALAYYRRAVELAPRQAQYHLVLGKALLAAGDEAGGRQELITTLALAQSNADIYLRLGRLAERWQAWPQAIQVYEQALAQGVVQVDIYTRLGDAYRMIGEDERAAALYRQAELLAETPDRK